MLVESFPTHPQKHTKFTIIGTSIVINIWLVAKWNEYISLYALSFYYQWFIGMKEWSTSWDCDLGTEFIFIGYCVEETRSNLRSNSHSFLLCSKLQRLKISADINFSWEQISSNDEWCGLYVLAFPKPETNWRKLLTSRDIMKLFIAP